MEGRVMDERGFSEDEMEAQATSNRAYRERRISGDAVSEVEALRNALRLAHGAIALGTSPAGKKQVLDVIRAALRRGMPDP